MRPLLHNLVPRRIGSQIAVLIVASLVLANVVTAAVFLLQTPPNQNYFKGALAHLAFTARLLDAAPSAQARADILRIARESLPELSELKALPPAPAASQDDPPARDLAAALGNRFSVVAMPPQEGAEQAPPRIAVRLPDGGIIAAGLPPPPPNGKPMLIATVTFLAVVLTLLFLWVARELTLPLTRFADAAERFSVDRSDAPLDEHGPAEISRLAHALNDMRERIRSLVEDRTRMLAAVGHDLRTPITRLRLRAEDIMDDHLRHQVIRDLDTMQHMVQSALSFLREQTAGRSKHVPTDLPSVLQALCDDFADMGRECSFDGPTHLHVDCDPDQLTRAIANLVDNGLKFADAVSVRVSEQGDDVVIDVTDDGPGIAEAERAKVFEPFYRGDSARGVGANGSFGLGLSIARSIVEAHHGRIELHDAVPGGLRARLILPKRSPASSGVTMPAVLAAGLS